jgi:hypothetical protein
MAPVERATLAAPRCLGLLSVKASWPVVRLGRDPPSQKALTCSAGPNVRGGNG